MKWITITAIVSLLGTAAFAEPLRIASDGTYPPFNTISADGSLSGFDIDIANALCEEMGIECKLVVQDWDGLIPGLVAGRYDAIIASMAATEERSKSVDFTERYYSTRPGVIVLKGSEISAATVEALDGTSIGAQSSTSDALYVEANIPSATLRLYPTPAEVQADLSAGRIDVMISDILVLSEFLKTDAGSCCRLLGALPPDPEVYGADVSIAVKKGNDELRTKLNAAIKALRENNTYQEINARYFDFDIYGD
jgi:polar amino acid transport system substrate-binding protein